VCVHGTYTEVFVIDKGKAVKVDACIADEIREINEAGVYTAGCCCGHGNGDPHALIHGGSVEHARSIGYEPSEYERGLYEMKLKTGGVAK
jgi:hypothetical protein